MGEGNSVTERMALAGAVDQGGLAMQETIFKQFQAKSLCRYTGVTQDGLRFHGCHDYFHIMVIVYMLFLYC